MTKEKIDPDGDFSAMDSPIAFAGLVAYSLITEPFRLIGRGIGRLFGKKEQGE